MVQQEATTGRDARGADDGVVAGGPRSTTARVGELPSRAPLSPQFSASIAWATSFGVLVAVNRLTVPDGQDLGLVFTAAGVAFLWLLARPATVTAMSTTLGAMILVQGLALTVTDTPPALAVPLVASTALQSLACVLLVRRWVPGVLGTGGTGSLHTPAALTRGVAAVGLGTAGAAAVGLLLAVALGERPDLVEAIVWWGRNLTGLVLVGILGHLAWERLDQRRRGVPPATTGERGGTAEAVALAALSLAASLLAFSQDVLPMVWMLVSLGVWAATRFSTLGAVAHTAVLGCVALVMTRAGQGPFDALADDEQAALVTEVFLLVQLLTVLAVATGRDRRDALSAELDRLHAETAARAELLDTMTEAMAEGLVVSDADGAVVRSNAAADRLVGRAPAHGRQHVDEVVLHHADGTPVSAAEHPSHQVLRTGPWGPADLTLVSEDGEQRILAVTAAPLNGGQTLGRRRGAVVVYRDVTEHRRAMQRLAEFAAVAAHDLRNPLTALRGWLDLALDTLQDDPDGAVVARACTALERARSSTDRLRDLVSDLLAQATAEGGQLHPRPMVLDGADGLVRTVALDLEDELGLDLDLRVGPVPPVLADADLVRQLLVNLMGNAVKYVTPGATPCLEVDGARLGDRVEIRVSDRGIGVPAEDRELVFERFHRAHGDDPAYIGSGLGLSICRTIVTRHGGTITCHAREDGPGTTFALDLPAAGEMH